TRRRRLVQLALALALLGALLWGLAGRRGGEDGRHRHGHGSQVGDAFERAGVIEFKEGQRGPAFRLARRGGGEATLDTWSGKLVVLNFWATWCTPCTTEMPTLEALWRAYRDRGLVVIGVSVDRGAPPALIDPYVRNLALTFPILFDPDSKTAGAWRVTGLPSTFVLRPDGDVAGVAVGPREGNSAEVRALLEGLLPGVRSDRQPCRGRPTAEPDSDSLRLSCWDHCAANYRSVDTSSRVMPMDRSSSSSAPRIRLHRCLSATLRRTIPGTSSWSATSAMKGAHAWCQWASPPMA